MLVQLDIENVAVIKKASIEFKNGFNIITGETGAGKSLLINSLNLVLGGRASREIIREGADCAFVTALFYAENGAEITDPLGIECDDGQIIVSRKLYADGRSVCRINSVTVNAGALKSVGERLIAIHGQRDSGILYKPQSHIDFLDSFARNDEIKKEYTAAYKEYGQACERFKTLVCNEKTRAEELDYLEYQINEMEKHKISESEEEELCQRRTLLENAQALSENSHAAYACINGERGACELLYTAKGYIQKLAQLSDGAESFFEKAENLYYECEALGEDIMRRFDAIESSPGELESICDRLDAHNALKRKYVTDTAGLEQIYEKCATRLENLKTYGESKLAAEAEVQRCKDKAESCAAALRKKRQVAAEILEKSIENELALLDMPHCRTEIKLFECELSSNGTETAEIFISTNPAESTKSISKIASGGEISRIMLAIKSVFAGFDEATTLLFDEIDTGVSGRAAEKIAAKMNALAKSFQIICVSHLPIMAAAANVHFLLEKKETESGFSTNIRQITGCEREREIARIIGGDNIDDTAIENAHRLLGVFGEK